MDNNFYNKKKKSKKKNREQANGYLIKITALQLVLSLLITGILFFVCSTETSLSNNVKEIYANICEQDFAVSKWLGSFKNVVRQTFSPKVKEENTIDEITESITGEEVNFSPDFIFGGVL